MATETAEEPTTTDGIDPTARACARVANLARRRGRDDLAERADGAAARVGRAGGLVLVVGEFKQGKSSLVNGLVGRAVCPVDDDLATSAITVLHHADELEVVVHRRVDGTATASRIEPRLLGGVVTEQGNPDNELGIERVEVGLPSALLRDAFAVVDSPGVGGLGAGHAAGVLAFLPRADAVIVASDATSELSAPELDFLVEATRRCRRVVLCQTKIDLSGAWREIVDRNRAHLAARGLDLPVLPVSSNLRLRAMRDRDRELNEESGFPALLDELRVRVVEEARARAGADAAAEALDVVTTLEAEATAELAVLADPASAADAAAAADAARARVERLRTTGSRWSQLLGERVAELSNEVTFRFREVQREIGRDAEAALDQRDDGWDDVVRDTQTAIATSVAELFGRIDEGLAEAVAAVAGAIEEDLDVDIGTHAPEALASALDSVTTHGVAAAAGVRQRASAAGGRALTALRGMQSGVMLLGLVGMMVPTLAAATPLVLGVGAAFGAKSVAEARRKRVADTRQATRATVRKLLDEVGFRVGNEVTQTLRRAQQQLRDDVGRQLTELQRTARERAEAAIAAAESTGEDRRRREAGAADTVERCAALRAHLEPVAA